MRKFLKIILILFIAMNSYKGFAQKPYTNKLEGSLTTNDIQATDCQVRSLTLGYRLGTIVGEPTVYLNVKWEGRSDDSECFSDERFKVFLNIGMGGLAYYVNAGGSAEMIVGKGNNEWGNNPLAGSPNWDKVICKNISQNPRELNYISAEEAKRIWKAGFNVHGAKLVTRSGKVISF
jgi:hypothetical protein